MKYLNYVFPIAAGLLLAACATSRIPGLPKGAQMVGGGGEISWMPQERGTAIVVERTTQKAVKTERVDNGSAFEFDVATSGGKLLVDALFPGKDLADLKFVLYFVPESREAAVMEKGPAK